MTISLPSGVPDKGSPKVNTFPDSDTLDGVDCDKLAVPPEM